MFYDLSIPEHRQLFNDTCKKYYTDEVSVELVKKQANRTLSQNSYLHVIFSLVGLHFGYTKEEVKQMLKIRRKDIFMYKKDKLPIEFYRSTADLDKEQMQKFIDWIIEYMNTKHQLYIPTSEEYLQNRYKIDKEISDNSNYLN